MNALEPTSGRLRWALVGGVAAQVLIVDQLTKIWAVRALADQHVIDLFWTLRLRLIRNFGSAFGLGSGLGRWLVLLVVGVVVAVLFWARQVHDRRVLGLLGLITGGAIGNLIDRAVRAENGFMSGGVVDFVDLQWWPVFNVADVAVVTGAIGLAIFTMFLEDDEIASADADDERLDD